MKNKKRDASYFPLPGLIALGFGLFFWILFYPGNLSVDSLYQYSQAITVCKQLLDSEISIQIRQKALKVQVAAYNYQKNFDNAALALVGQR